MSDPGFSGAQGRDYTGNGATNFKRLVHKVIQQNRIEQLHRDAEDPSKANISNLLGLTKLAALMKMKRGQEESKEDVVAKKSSRHVPGPKSVTEVVKPKIKMKGLANLVMKFRKTEKVSAAKDEELNEFLERFTVTRRSYTEENEAPTYELKDVLTIEFWRTLVMDPSGHSYYYWSMVLMFAVLYNLISICLRVAFDQASSGNHLHILMTVDYICDVIYLMDMFVMARKGFLDKGLLVRNVSLLRKRYVWSWKFVVDVLALLPFDFFYFLIGFSATLRGNRLAKIWRFTEFMNMAETHTNFPNLIRISVVILYILILIHWFGCIYFLLSYFIGFGSDAWVFGDITKPGLDTFWHQYSIAFYWATLTLTTIGDTPLPETPIETWFCVVCSLMGVLIFATVFGNVGAMIKNMDGERITFQNKVDSVKSYMDLRGIGPDLQDRVIKWFDYTWKNKQSVDDRKPLKLFPDKLRAEISIHVHMNTLRKVAILQDCEPGLLVDLVVKLKLQVYSPGDFICKKGDIGKEMYIVKRGKLQVISEDGTKVFVTLTEGAVFGEISVLDIPGNKTMNRRTACVKTVGFSDLFCLTKHDLWESLADYPEARTALIERGKIMLKRDNMFDEEQSIRAERRNMDLALKMDIVNDVVNDVKKSNKVIDKRVDQFQATIAKMNQKINELSANMEVVETLNQTINHFNAHVEAIYRKSGGMPIPVNTQKSPQGKNAKGKNQSFGNLFKKT